MDSRFFSPIAHNNDATDFSLDFTLISEFIDFKSTMILKHWTLPPQLDFGTSTMMHCTGRSMLTLVEPKTYSRVTRLTFPSILVSWLCQDGFAPFTPDAIAILHNSNISALCVLEEIKPMFKTCPLFEWPCGISVDNLHRIRLFGLWYAPWFGWDGWIQIGLWLSSCAALIHMIEAHYISIFLHQLQLSMLILVLIDASAAPLYHGASTGENVHLNPFLSPRC